MIDSEILLKTRRNKKPLLSIILYTDRHPHIKKCLRDEDYWKAFDESSGSNWIIAAVKPKQGDYRMPASSGKWMSLMVPIWQEPDDNKPLIKFLELDDTKELPVILFYKIIANEIIDSIYIKIEGDTQDETYNDIQDIINKIAKVVEDEGDFFENAKSAIRKEKIFRTIKRGKKLLSDFNSLIPGIL